MRQVIRWSGWLTVLLIAGCGSSPPPTQSAARGPRDESPRVVDVDEHERQAAEPAETSRQFLIHEETPGDGATSDDQGVPATAAPESNEPNEPNDREPSAPDPASAAAAPTNPPHLEDGAPSSSASGAVASPVPPPPPSRFPVPRLPLPPFPVPQGSAPSSAAPKFEPETSAPQTSAPQAPTTTSFDPAGGAAPPPLPVASAPRRPLPAPIHMNPLRATPGSRAAQPLVIETPRVAEAPSVSPPRIVPSIAPTRPLLPTLPKPAAGPPRIPSAPPVIARPDSGGAATPVPPLPLLDTTPTAPAPTATAPTATAPTAPSAESTPDTSKSSAPPDDDDPVALETMLPPEGARTINVGRKRAAPPRRTVAEPETEMPDAEDSDVETPSSETTDAAPPEMEAPEPETADSETATPAAVAPAVPKPAVRDRRVRVFYGTDRRAVGDPREFYEWNIGWIPGILAGLVALAAAASAFFVPNHRVWLTVGSILAATISGVMILRGPLAGDPPPSEPSPRGVEFTTDRGRLSVGWCDVTIPPHHDPGEVESPSILKLQVRPDPEKHVVLERVVRQDRDPFFEMVRERVQQSPRRDLFLFVHGYNVSFEDAARRTAQISFDLEFEGAAMFFSWPSQDDVLQYTVDENNVAWCVSHLKEFLLDVVRRTDAKSVNLIAHSMGNRALGAAIRELESELRRDDAIFNEVVLAAPDVDASIFKRDIAPALRRAARHATLYASNHDQALLVSKIVHGYPRAGDSGAGLVLVDGIETIDVSRIDLSLLGHSYYGSSEPLLDDLAELLSQSRRPSQRTWLRPTERDGVQYWTFREDLRNRRTRVSRLAK